MKLRLIESDDYRRPTNSTFSNEELERYIDSELRKFPDIRYKIYVGSDEYAPYEDETTGAQLWDQEKEMKCVENSTTYLSLEDASARNNKIEFRVYLSRFEDQIGFYSSDDTSFDLPDIENGLEDMYFDKRLGGVDLGTPLYSRNFTIASKGFNNGHWDIRIIPNNGAQMNKEMLREALSLLRKAFSKVRVVLWSAS